MLLSSSTTGTLPKLTTGQLWIAWDLNFQIGISITATWRGCRGWLRGCACAFLLGNRQYEEKVRDTTCKARRLVWMRLQSFMQPPERGMVCRCSKRVQGRILC
ncbi:hypothetical protein CGRA01v4_09738 [Colletotrichum graminicola]|nr:hypothetical protein CGRA01v4_09738 [Colletotrichum graminicola]